MFPLEIALVVLGTILNTDKDKLGSRDSACTQWIQVMSPLFHIAMVWWQEPQLEQACPALSSAFRCQLW